MQTEQLLGELGKIRAALAAIGPCDKPLPRVPAALAVLDALEESLSGTVTLVKALDAPISDCGVGPAEASALGRYNAVTLRDYLDRTFSSWIGTKVSHSVLHRVNLALVRFALTQWEAAENTTTNVDAPPAKRKTIRRKRTIPRPPRGDI